jgi:septal ring factor EnvC (AmiA/AmiB activator)
MDCAEYEQRAEKAVSLIAMLSSHLRLHPDKLRRLRPQIQSLKNTLSEILIAPSESAMDQLEHQIDSTLSNLDQPNRTIN